MEYHGLGILIFAQPVSILSNCLLFHDSGIYQNLCNKAYKAEQENRNQIHILKVFLKEFPVN